jgi:hypothetical protein
MPAPAERRRFRALPAEIVGEPRLRTCRVRFHRIGDGPASLFHGAPSRANCRCPIWCFSGAIATEKHAGVTQPLAFEDQHAQAYNESGTTRFQSPQVANPRGRAARIVTALIEMTSGGRIVGRIGCQNRQTLRRVKMPNASANSSETKVAATAPHAP